MTWLVAASVSLSARSPTWSRAAGARPARAVAAEMGGHPTSTHTSEGTSQWKLYGQALKALEFEL